MLSYQHGYHAGNFADVLKHFTLCRLINYLTIKDKPFLYLDTHAGSGLYDLSHKQAKKTLEHEQGIKKLLQHKSTLPLTFKPYLNSIEQINTSDYCRYYPGSPYLAASMMRKQDRIYACELHPGEFSNLKNQSFINKKIHCSREDGIIALKALLPPPEKRGLIFIDPSFEIKEDYRDIPYSLHQAHRRFSTGVYCLWYPIVDNRTIDKMIRKLQVISPNSALHVQLKLNTAKEGMDGTGLWIINPPYTLKDELFEALGYLQRIFDEGKSTFILEKY